ncbi:MAG: peptidylprolyl isomerase [Candidatus Omnitrophota bacterium]
MKRNEMTPKLSRIHTPLLVLSALAFFLTACGEKHESIPSPVKNLAAATYDDLTVTAQDILIAFQESRNFIEILIPNPKNPNADKDLIKEIAGQIAFNRYLEQKARESGLADSETYRQNHAANVDEELYQKIVIDEILRKIKITENEKRQFYDINKMGFYLKPHTNVYMVRGIYINNEGDPEKAEKAMTRLREAHGRLKKGESFESVAKEYSDAEVGMVDKRGVLNEIPPGVAPPEIEDRLKTLKDGEFCEPYEYANRTRIYLKEKFAEPEFMPFEEAKDSITKRLYGEKQNQGVFILMQELQMKYSAVVEDGLLKNGEIANASSTILSVPGIRQLTLGEFLKETERLGKYTLKDQVEYLNLLLNKAVFLAEARKRNLSEEDVAASAAYYDRNWLASKYIESLYADQPLTEEQMRAIFDQNRSNPALALKDVYELQHLFFRAAYSPAMPYAERMARMQRAESYALTARSMMENGESFVIIAENFSQEPSADADGGFYGRIPGDRIPAAAQKAVDALAAGEISQPQSVQDFLVSRYGFELFYVKEIEPGRPMTFEEARPIIERSWKNDRFAETQKQLKLEFEKSHPPSVEEAAVQSIVDYLKRLAPREDLHVDIARYEES